MSLNTHALFGSLCAALACTLVATPASAVSVTIDFSEVAAGTTLTNQYAALGVTFTPNAFSGPGSSSTGEDWATNTGLKVVSLTGGDVGGLGTPNLASGNLLHSYSDWFDADGDPSFRIGFAAPIDSFSATFVGVNFAPDVTLWAYNGLTQVGTVSGTGSNGQFVLSLAAPTITSIVVRPGSYQDWVGVDSIGYTVSAVPEVGTCALMALGLGLIAVQRRKAA